MVRAAPTDAGRVSMLVRRPAVDEREIVESATLDPEVGVVGDTWRDRSEHQDRRTGHPTPGYAGDAHGLSCRCACSPTPTSSAHCAGDQVFVDLDLGGRTWRRARGSPSAPPSSRCRTCRTYGCAKFAARFGNDALRFVNSPVGRELNFRGLNVAVVQGGIVRVGDTVTKL